MTAASIQKLTVEFGGNMLFHDVSFDINEGDFVGLIGANGTGKTTLFKIIRGELEPAEGGVFISKKIKLGYLEQHACQGSVRSVYEEALTAFDYLIEEEREINRVTALLESDPDNRDELIEKLNVMQEHFNLNDGLTFRSRTASALKGLGFSEKDFSLSCLKLSGGQRSKLSMCKLLLSNSNLLLLDEPTNHLDISGTEWLEAFLQNYKGTVLVISHDRYFLDKICNKTVEIANKTAYYSKGNYSDYHKIKQERLEVERHHYENQLEEIKKLEEFVQRAQQASATNHVLKRMGQERAEWLEKKKAELIVPEQDPGKMRISFTPECETGNDVLNVLGLSKAFGEKKLFSGGDMQVFKKDRAFILGCNGCGKTTLLRILTRQQYADEGSFHFGAGVKIGYFDQSLESLRGGKAVIDEIWDEHRTFKETTVRNYLALFLFKGDDVYKNVDSLSGGEKAKLCLLKLMLSGANVLLLDEPTNHLDITSREILENALADFGGTIIAVSHDRYFINKLSTKIYRMKTDGFEKFDGNYDDYCRIVLNEPVQKEKPKVQSVNSYKLRKERESEINRLRGKIRRGEEEIDRLDGKINELSEALSTPEVSADYEKVIAYTAKIDELTASQLELMNNWEEWNARLEELESE